MTARTTEEFIEHHKRSAQKEHILSMLAEDPAKAQEHRDKEKKHRKRAQAFSNKRGYEKAVKDMDTGARDYEDTI